MEISDAISLIDYTLITTGLKLYLKNPYQKLVNAICFVYLVSESYYELVQRTIVAINTEGVHRLYLISSLIYSLCVISEHHIIFIRRGDIRKFLTKLESQLTSLDIKRIRQFSITLFMVYIASMMYRFGAIFIGAKSYFFIKLSEQWLILNSIHVSMRIVAYNYLGRTAVVYMMFFHIVYIIDLGQLNSLRHRLMTKQIVDITTESLRRKKILKLRAKFDQLFGLYPSSWLFMLMINVGGYLVNRDNVVVAWYFFASYLILTIGPLYYVIHADGKLGKLAEKIELLFMERAGNGLNFQQRDLIQLIKQRPLLTGCQQFEIKPSLALTFIGSTITFSVLFIQIIGNQI